MKLKQTPEEVDKQIELPPVCVTLVDYNVEIVDPAKPMQEKIAIAARTCYRSEDGNTSDRKLIAGCTKRGHTSVLEHGAISLYLPVTPDEETSKMIQNVLGAKGRAVPLRKIWDRLPTLTSQRYATEFNDAKIFEKHYDELDANVKKYPKDADISLPVIVADVRAWRDILFERLYIADNVTQDPISWIVTIAAVFRMYNIIPEAFSDLADGIIQRIKSFKEVRKNKEETPRFAPIEALLLNKLTDEELDNFCLAKFLEKFFGENFNVIIADEVDPSMTCTIVLTTDRAVTHEHVRHRRDVGYSQESQRYVNYEKKGYEVCKFTCDPAKVPEGVEVDPYTGVVAEDEVASAVYDEAVTHAFAAYEKLLSLGFPPEVSRKVLPNGCRTKIVVTWLLPIGFSNFMRWRTEKFAHYDIRLAADQILYKLLKMKHPFLNILGTKDLYRWTGWMKEQKIFNEEILKEIDCILAERSAVEEEIMRQAKEAQEAQEQARLEAMKQSAEGDGIVVDDHVTKKMPVSNAAPVEIKVGRGEQSGTPEEPVTERPATIQFEKKEEGEEAPPKEEQPSQPSNEGCDGSPA